MWSNSLHRGNWIGYWNRHIKGKSERKSVFVFCDVMFTYRCINLPPQKWGWIPFTSKCMWCGWSSSLWKWSLTSSSLSSTLSLSSGNLSPCLLSNFIWGKKGTLKANFPFRIRKAMKERQSMTQEMSAEVNEATRGQQKKDKNMAVVLICIVVMFILCQSLKIIPDIFEAFFCDHSNDISTCQSPFSLEILISVSHLMLAVNSASNFLIYMLRGDKFRQFFFQIFFRCQCTRASRRSKEANR